MRTNEVIFYKNKQQNNYQILIKQLDNSMFSIACFHNVEQLKRFLKEFNIKLIHVSTHYNGTERDCKIYKTNKKITNEKVSFWNLSEIPKGAKKHLILSNGHIVNGFVKQSRYELKFYRPNPNTKNVYNPLTTEEHIAFQRLYGVY